MLSQFGLVRLDPLGRAEQARFLEGHVREAELAGLAGQFVFSWTDDWFTGGHPIQDLPFPHGQLGERRIGGCSGAQMLDQSEVAMPIARMILAGASALCILTSIASAEPLTGRVMGINRLTNTIAIQQAQDGTVGANGGVTEEFRAQDGVSLDNVHVEDRVSYTVSKAAGVKTITKLERQK